MSHLFDDAIPSPGSNRSHFLDLIAGLTYAIEARGRDSGAGTLADPYLLVGGPGYFNLAFDDDSGVGRNAGFDPYRPLVTGSYGFFVSGNGGQGSYELFVSTGFGTAGRDVVTGTETGNHIDGLAGDDSIEGRGGDDQLWGGAGRDTLDGGIGADWMVGGIGDDTYVVDAPGDLVVERPGEGRDLVRSMIGSYTLAANVEDLTLGYFAFRGTGNALGNRITANGPCDLRGLAGNDTLIGGSYADALDGGGGADVMRGGWGGDSYVVDNPGDQVVESEMILVPTGGGFGSGTDADRVSASIDYSLPAHVEDLQLVDGARNGTGNALANWINGNAAMNTLRGGAGADILSGYGGADVLIGGPGADVFLYEFSDISSPEAPDRIRAAAGAPAFGAGGNVDRSGNGDLILLSGIDANESTAGHQDFVGDGTRGVGRLWFETDGTDTVVRANTLRGAAVEIEIRIEDGATRHQDYRLMNVGAHESIVTLL
jgi:Ca2+-binding RTX toxin-like protein